MSKDTLEKVALKLNVTADWLMDEFARLGAPVKNKSDKLTDKQTLTLIKIQNNMTDKSESKDNDGKQAIKKFTLQDIQNAEELQQLDAMLTQLMAKQKLQPLIQDDKLDLVTDRILELAETEPEEELLAAAMLGRLAAVARNRDVQVFARTNELFTKEPPSIETLADGDAKAYASAFLRHADEAWVEEYSYREAMAIDVAGKARWELLDANLKRRTPTLTSWMQSLREQAPLLREIGNSESRLKRVRRVARTMGDIMEKPPWRGEVGEDVGPELAALFKSLMPGGLDDVDREIPFEALDSLLAVLRRVIELRFSSAMYPELYSIIPEGRNLFGHTLWPLFIEESEVLPDVQMALLESSLVLARQDKYDKGMLEVLSMTFSSDDKMKEAIKQHFSNTRDLDPTVSAWWCKGGRSAPGMGQQSQKVRNSEDEKIGELLLKLEESREVMEKLGRGVLPILEPLNPVLAKTVEKAVFDYKEMARHIQSLSRMRQLKPAGLLSERMDYNHRQHDMVGGHRSGVRRIRVVRDGIEKNFAGTTRMLVKPWVEPEE